jgi:hypothetical protein
MATRTGRVRVEPRRLVPHAAALLGVGLGLVHGAADDLQVAVVVAAALLAGHDVVDCVTDVHKAVAQARLAHAAVTLQDALADLVPGRAVPALMACAARLVGERAGAHLVRLATAGAVTNEHAAVGAGLWS